MPALALARVWPGGTSHPRRRYLGPSYFVVTGLHQVVAPAAPGSSGGLTTPFNTLQPKIRRQSYNNPSTPRPAWRAARAPCGNEERVGFAR